MGLELVGVHRALSKAISQASDDDRRNALTDARNNIESLGDLGTRAPLTEAWGILYGDFLPQPDDVLNAYIGPRLFSQSSGGLTRVSSIRELLVGAASSPQTLPSGLDGIGRLFRTRSAAALAFILGFLIALLIDLSSTFGADAGWGTPWDMFGAFARAFTVTGGLQVVRTLGSAATD